MLKQEWLKRQITSNRCCNWKHRLLIFCSLIVISFNLYATERIAPPLNQIIKNAEGFSSDTGALILHKQSKIVVAEDGSDVTQFYIAIRIDDDMAAKDYGMLSSHFNAYYVDAELEFAQITDAEGKVHYIAEDAVQIETDNDEGSLSDTRRLSFALPSVRPGSIIEFQIKKQEKRALLPEHWFAHFYFQYSQFAAHRGWLRVDPLARVTYELSLPKAFTLNLKQQHINITPQKREAKDHTEYSWTLANIDGIKVESNMGYFPSQLKMLTASTVPNWNSIDQWGKDIYLPAASPDSVELKALAKSLTQGLKTDIEKAKAIFNYVQANIRYIGAHVERGGFIPHSAAEVFQQKYGDCKDQVMLIVALLNAVDIEAYPALVGRDPQLDVSPSVPTLSFSHMITYLPNAGEELWLDTSGETGSFPGITANLQNRYGFIIDGSGGALKRLPIFPAEHNIAKVTITYDFNGKRLDATVKMTFAGLLENTMRNLYLFSPEKEKLTRELFSPFIGDNQAKIIKVPDIVSFDAPFFIEAQFEGLLERDNQEEVFTYQQNIDALLQLFTEFNALPEPSTKHYGYANTMAFTLTIESHFERPDSNFSIALKKPGTGLENDIFGLSYDIEPNDYGAVATSQFWYKKRLLDREEYGHFYQQLKQAKEASINHVVFARQNSDKDKTADLPIEQMELTALLESIRDLLSNAQYEEAYNLALTTNELHSESGESHYLLGITLGLTDQYEAADRSFAKAKQLGYEQ